MLLDRHQFLVLIRFPTKAEFPNRINFKVISKVVDYLVLTDSSNIDYCSLLVWDHVIEHVAIWL